MNKNKITFTEDGKELSEKQINEMLQNDNLFRVDEINSESLKYVSQNGERKIKNNKIKLDLESINQIGEEIKNNNEQNK